MSHLRELKTLRDGPLHAWSAAEEGTHSFPQGLAQIMPRRDHEGTVKLK